MASFNIRALVSGYTNVNSDPVEANYSRNTAIRLSSANIGGLRFETPLNSVFNASASSISGLGIKSANLGIKVTSAISGIFTIAISNSVIDKDFTRIYSKRNLSTSQEGLPVGEHWFNIASLFTTTNGNSTYLTPNDSTWYLYFKTARLSRLASAAQWSYTIHFQTHEGTIQYYNGSSWQIATPYYYNGTSWVPCTAQYYNGSSWIQC